MQNKRSIKTLFILTLFIIMTMVVINEVLQYIQDKAINNTLTTTSKQNSELKETTRAVEIVEIELLFDYDYQNLSLDEIITLYMNENGLNESNFSISYYNFYTEDSFYFNENTLMFAASTYKLPLNMYYSQKIAEGVYSDSSLLYYDESCNEDSLGYVYQHYEYGDYIDLKTLQYQSIIASDNVSSWILFNGLGGWSQMMENISIYSEDYYVYCDYNYFNTGFMLDALKYLYQNTTYFTNLLEYLQNDTFTCYLGSYLEEIEIANKYGNYSTVYNDVGIVYANSPYAIAIFTDSTSKGSDCIAELNRIIYEYNTVNAS